MEIHHQIDPIIKWKLSSNKSHYSMKIGFLNNGYLPSNKSHYSIKIRILIYWISIIKQIPLSYKNKDSYILDIDHQTNPIII